MLHLIAINVNIYNMKYTLFKQIVFDVSFGHMSEIKQTSINVSTIKLQSNICYSFLKVIRKHVVRKVFIE